MSGPVYWETIEDDEPVVRDFAQIWRGADKVVYSTTLRDVSLGGPTLAAHALRAGIVDRLNLYLHPVVVGGGTPALPDGVRLDLRLRSERRFTGGAVHVAYDVRREAGPPG